MKIAFYIGGLVFGGAERVVVNLADYLHKQGMEISILTPNKSEKEYPMPEGVARVLTDLTAEEVSFSRIKNIYLRYKKLRECIHSEKADLVVSFIGLNNINAISACRALHLPVVVSVRSAPQREYASKRLKFAMKRLFPKATGIILQTREAYDYFPKSIQKRAVILPNPLREEFVRKPFDGERQKTIVTVGRLDGNKNQIVLLRAFEQVAEQYPDYRLVLYGEGPMSEKWQKLASGSPYADRIEFAGHVDRVADTIADAGLFVLPSLVEGMPNALMEAMALGIPCISANCSGGGPKELLGDNEYGVLVNFREAKGFVSQEEQVNRLAKGLRSLLADDSLREEYGRKAHERSKDFLPERVNEMWRAYLLSKM